MPPCKSDVSLANDLSVVHLRRVLNPTTSVAASRLEDALDTQTQILREEQGRTAEIDRRIEALRREMEECVREREISTKRQSALSQTIAIYQDLLRLADGIASDDRPFAAPVEADGQPPPPAGRDEAKPRLVARLGKQHYRMLYVLREKGPLALEDLARVSIVSLRRVKVQMAEDMEPERSVVTLSDGKYGLTPEGADLLKRFEDFRRLNGQELPSLDAPQSEADRDEADPETPNEGDEG